MRRHLTPIFWIEAILAAANALLLVLTLVWEDWIEIVFGIDPDNHSGSLEWLIVIVCLCALPSSSRFSHASHSSWRR
jgi:hypothetical protein